jgi:hypothetical protein
MNSEILFSPPLCLRMVWLLWGAWIALGISVEAGAAHSAFSQVYLRATNHFATVEFFRPRDTNTSELTFKLAPLILQQTPAHGRQRPRANPFGRLVLRKDRLRLDDSRPMLYVVPDTVEIHGKAHARLTYVWVYSLKPTSPGSALPLQGVRITLNSAGAPAIWEVLADKSGADVVFVSESLAQAAAAEFGAPLPGRKYSIEQSLGAAPRTVVARVIDDGPIPMGPIVYLSAPTHSVATLICRCMPAQARRVSASYTYDLVAPGDDSILERLKMRTSLRIAFWPGEPDQRSLQQVLRLPAAGW